MFLPAYRYKTDKLTDISYALTFIVIALYGYFSSTKTPEHLAVTLLVSAWAVRLGSFLFMRINKMKRDKRFDGMRENFFKFLRFWLLQAVTVFVVLLGPIALWNSKETAVTFLSVIGILVFISGLTLEAVADRQKFQFNNDPKNKDKWIHQGVWKLSRHPNYLGEMLVWIGMYGVVLPSLSGALIFYALISPVYIISLLMFVSGVPLLEKAADKKWGSDKSYLTYKKQTPALLPKLWK